MPDLVQIRLLFHEDTHLAKGVGHGDSRLVGGHAVELRQRRHVHGAVERDDVDDRQVVSRADLVVGGVMSWRHLERARAELGSHRWVLEDRNHAPRQRERRVLANERFVACIAGRNRDAGVTEHRLGADGGDGDVSVVLHHRILQVVERIGVLLPVDLLVTDR